MRTTVIRAAVQRLLTQVPFRPFVITLENRQRATVDHPENMAIDFADEGGTGSEAFYVRVGTQKLFATFEAVTSITHQDQIA